MGIENNMRAMMPEPDRGRTAGSEGRAAIDAPENANGSARAFRSKSPSAERRTYTIEAMPRERQKLRVAAYCRVSTAGADQESSISAQRRHYEDYIKAHPDWELAGIYWEAGVSGTRAETRPELQRLIADCEARRVDLVLTKSISRFARNTTECLEMVRALTSLGVGIVFQKENIDTRTMQSEFLLTLFSSIAEEESHSIASNARWAVQKRFQSGTFKYSKAPYGYALRDGTFVICPEAAEIVREIFRRVLSGEGTIVIARDLNARGIPTGTRRRDGTDGVWSSQMILGMIKNVAYTGDILMQKTFAERDYHRRRNNGEREQYYMDHHHAAIIDQETYALANAVLAQRAREKGNGSGAGRNPRLNRYALSGKLFCGRCGASMKRLTGKRAGGTDYYWGCRTHQDSAVACPMKREKEETIKNAFATMLNKLAFAPVIDVYMDRLAAEEQVRGGQRAAELKAREQSIAEERNRIAFLLSRGCGELLPFRKRLDALEAEELGLQGELERLRGGTPEMKETLVVKRAISEWRAGTNDIDGQFAKIVDHAAVNTGESITFHLKCGLALTETTAPSAAREANGAVPPARI